MTATSLLPEPPAALETLLTPSRAVWSVYLMTEIEALLERPLSNIEKAGELCKIVEREQRRPVAEER
jgi:hypothetical protein